ncbi:MAG: sigma factor-like helix-turn-helix DNA-binding protein [Prolixibacteraceae bacterium]|nr:sigma factor-like helix-turn-helix DNA-binding protein [Prolixibacteraceae bacterium]
MKKLYHIKQNGELVPVTEEVYRAYQQPKWREKKQEEVRAMKETSLDVMLESGHEIRLNLGQALIEDTVLDKLLLDELLAAIMKLNDDERSLLHELFYKEKSEREIAKEMEISSIAIHKRKHKIINKLRQFLNIQ